MRLGRGKHDHFAEVDHLATGDWVDDPGAACPDRIGGRFREALGAGKPTDIAVLIPE